MPCPLVVGPTTPILRPGMSHKWFQNLTELSLQPHAVKHLDDSGGWGGGHLPLCSRSLVLAPSIPGPSPSVSSPRALPASKLAFPFLPPFGSFLPLILVEQRLARQCSQCWRHNKCTRQDRTLLRKLFLKVHRDRLWSSLLRQ